MRIVGRELELDLVRGFLDAAASSPRLLHLHGEAGIGKSILWERALAEASERGARVASSRPTEAEARLPFAGLTDLLGDPFDETARELPEPQRMALEVALLRRTADGPPPDPLAISLGATTLLRTLAAQRPLIVAIDDLPWLDESSASILEFALRRLDAEPVGFIVAERTGAGARAAPPLLSALAADRVTEVAMRPLSERETDRLLAATLNLDLPPSELSALYATSGGNPFYAVEMGRAMQRRRASGAGADLRLPETLSGLVKDRLEALPEAAAAVVAHAAALSQPSVRVLHEVVGSSATAGLDEATTAGVLSVHGDAVRFGHPLLAAEAYGRLDEAERRQLHRRLALAVREPEEYARHLALASPHPDERVAQKLEAAAEHAYARGAPAEAAAMIERAILLTEGDEEARLRRRVTAAQHRLVAGDVARARALLEAALEDAPRGDARARVLMGLGNVRQLMDDWEAAGDLLERALAEASSDARLTIDIKVSLAGVSHIAGRDPEAGAGHIADAMRLAEELGDPRIIAGTIGPYATWQWAMERRIPDGLEERAAELEAWTDHLRTLNHPTFDFSIIKRSQGDLAGFRATHDHLLQRAERIGDYSSITFLLANLAIVDFIQGEAGRARDRVERAERLARTTGQQTALAHVLGARTCILGRTGDADEALRVGRSVLDVISTTGWRHGEPFVRHELALLELSRRDPAAAYEVLQGFAWPGSSPDEAIADVLVPIAVEALVGLGRTADARALLDRLDADPRTARTFDLGTDAMAARALLLAAEGNLEAATALAGEAQARHRASGNRWEEARTSLIAGEIHRRARRRARARDALRAAATTFDVLGAALWSTQAGEQLDRIGAPRAASGGLTPTQHEVAELVASGLTNREVAARLFMSSHTVEAHLSAVYRTLGIRSRTELARALGDPDPEPRDSDKKEAPEA